MHISRKAVRWCVAAAYTAAIFAVTIFVNFWGILTRMLGTERAGDFLNYAVPSLGVVVVVYALYTLRRKRIRSMLWLSAVLCGYVYMLTLHCEYPADQIHLAQYSLLAWLFYRALVLTFAEREPTRDQEPAGLFAWGKSAVRNSAALYSAALLTLTVGAADEGLQFFAHWLHQTYGSVENPGFLISGLLAVVNDRRGDFADILTNWVAGGLGLVGLLALIEGGYWKWHKCRRLGTRFALGYVLPTALAVLALHQVYDRFIDRPINLMLITVDCCRPDRMSAYGENYVHYENESLPPTTEFLDKLMPEAIRFDNAYAQACWTAPGVVSVMSGLYPAAHGVDRAGRILPVNVQTILDGFRDRGYTVPNLAYITEDPTFHNLGSVQPLDPNKDQKTVVTDWIGAHHREPFAVWYHYRHLHLPYVPEDKHLIYPPAVAGAEFPEKIREIVQKEVIVPRDLVRFEESDRAWLKALYDAQVHQFDHFFESIRYKLKLHHILDDTLIVITADHGEELLEHGDLGHGSTLVYSKHYEEVLRIPLIMYCPKLVETGREIPTLVEQVDILPTIYDLMGWPIPKDVQGRSLLPEIRGEKTDPKKVFASSIEGGYQSKPDMANTWINSMRDRNWKFIERVGDGERSYQLFDLVLDPLEKKNLAGTNTRFVQSLIGEIRDWLASSVVIREHFLQEEEAMRAAAEAGLRVDPSLLTAPVITYPETGSAISYDDLDGRIAIRWTGYPNAMYVLQFSVGEGSHWLRNEMDVFGTEIEFGPFDEEFWNTLEQWNPYRVRIRPKDLPDAWSQWGEATIAPVEQ